MVDYLLLTAFGMFLFSFGLGIFSVMINHKLKGFERMGDLFNLLGMFALLVLILHLWITHQRPPLQTLRETRLWYCLLLPMCGMVINVFFFQAEDGIRDWSVTGVQTCALPI